jgi:hypothetical protein
MTSITPAGRFSADVGIDSLPALAAIIRFVIPRVLHWRIEGVYSKIEEGTRRVPRNIVARERQNSIIDRKTMRKVSMCL